MTDDNKTRTFSTDDLREAGLLYGDPRMIRVRDDEASEFVPLLGEASNRLQQPDTADYLARQEAEAAAYVAAQETDNRRNIRMAALQLAATRTDHGDAGGMIESAAKIEAFIIDGAKSDAVTVQ